MHILFLTQIIPFPPDAGPKVKTWHVLRYLAGQGHRITLVSFVRPEEEAHVPALSEVSDRVLTVPIRRSRAADIGYWLRSHLTGRPFLVERDDSAAMRRIVRQVLAGGDVDIIHADQLTMAQFAPAAGYGWQVGAAEKQPAALLDDHNAVWTILARMQTNVAWYLKPVVALEARRVKRYEGEIIGRFDAVIAVTEIDRSALLEAAVFAGLPAETAGARLSVIPIAVDTRSLQPADLQPESLEIVTLGTLHYPPNADGIRWFFEEVFPLVRARLPAAKLTIIGKNPPKDFLAAAEQMPDAVNVTGYVESLDPYFAAAGVVVIPVRAGGGMRVRILEAFARAAPVVTTTIGLEGIEARHGTDLLVADTAEDFAAAVVRILSEPDLRARLAVSGRQLVETRYDWQVVLGDMHALYRRLR